MAQSKESPDEAKQDEIIFNIGDTINDYEIVSKIDEGGFGQVFKVTKDHKTFYAMKLESNFQVGGSAIKLEINVLSQLPKNTVFPELICGGKRPRYHFLVLELLGDNLKALKAQSPNPSVFSDGTWSRIGIQCLYAMKMMHDSGFVHRDIKPSNFAIGYSTASESRSRRVLLFDFGLARKFVKKEKNLAPIVTKKESKISKSKTLPSKGPSTKSKDLKPGRSKPILNRKAEQMKIKKNFNMLIPPKSIDQSQRTAEEKVDDEEFTFRRARPHTDFRGTFQYASPNAHLQLELGRHDDIWSLMYMVAEFFVELPWTSNEEIALEELKNQSSILRLFSDDKNPSRLTPEMRGQLDEIDKNLKSCNYYSSPKYDIVYQFFKDSMTKAKVTWTTPYDWETIGKSSEDFSKKSNGKRAVWENPGAFFKKGRWDALPLPLQSPHISIRKSSSKHPKPSAKGSKKAVQARIQNFSKEDSVEADEAPTPMLKSTKKDGMGGQKGGLKGSIE
ncbi:Protein kinase domain-containing protein [Caenorhabditis elegans]|uniref:Protein kinase domain-containing protein n=1 Tax=Caenorhabditis elegans TaxID=6239 RepID=Q18707_CAEEL|nr:Protein kinase domain-containing protein [Caenorhabditis elegans]CCD67641.2 Protein kinase domain-containing protein [Caenorhabditis elegans]|eukprot:NP_501483.2 Uncharacterized protein CELE_C49C8.1 [Caenorhabditis elegans]